MPPRTDKRVWLARVRRVSASIDHLDSDAKGKYTVGEDCATLVDLGHLDATDLERLASHQ